MCTTISIRWSHDGAGILTGGEDGAVKIWSRSGMLRSTLAQNAAPVYALAWAPDTQSVLFASGTILTIKSLAPNSKPLQWRAHEALILCVDWSPSNGKIISGMYVVLTIFTEFQIHYGRYNKRAGNSNFRW